MNVTARASSWIALVIHLAVFRLQLEILQLVFALVEIIPTVLVLFFFCDALFFLSFFGSVSFKFLNMAFSALVLPILFATARVLDCLSLLLSCSGNRSELFGLQRAG